MIKFVEKHEPAVLDVNDMFWFYYKKDIIRTLDEDHLLKNLKQINRYLVNHLDEHNHFFSSMISNYYVYEITRYPEDSEISKIQFLMWGKTRRKDGWKDKLKNKKILYKRITKLQEMDDFCELHIFSQNELNHEQIGKILSNIGFIEENDYFPNVKLIDYLSENSTILIGFVYQLMEYNYIGSKFIEGFHIYNCYANSKIKL